MNRLPIQNDEKPFDIHELLNKFWRRKRLFLYVAVPILAYVLFTQLTKPYKPLYRATFDIGVTNEMPVEGMFSGATKAPTLQIGAVTQRVISSLLSVNLAEKVVDNISLCAFVKDGASDIRVETRLKEDIRHPIGPLKLKLGNGTYTLYDDDRKLGEGSFGSYWIYEEGTQREQGALDEYDDFGDFELRVTPLQPVHQRKTYELTIFPKKTTALALRNSLSITVLEADKIEQLSGSSGLPSSGEGAKRRLVRATSLFPGMNLLGVLRIEVHWANKEDALEIANALAQQIIEEDKTEKLIHFTQSKAFIDSMLQLYHGRLTHLEENIKDFKEKKGITNLAVSTQALIGQASTLESSRSQLQIEKKILQDIDRYLNAPGVDTGLTYSATLMGDPMLSGIYTNLLQVEAEYRAALKEYSSGHPKVMQISAQLTGLKEQLKEETRKRLSTLNTEISSVSRQINVLQGRLENVPEDEIQLARLGRDRETAEKLYTFFAEKLEETRVQEAGVTSDLKIINPPLVSGGPVNSKGTLKNLITAIVLSILGGSAAVFVADYLDKTVKDPDVVKHKLGLPLYGTVPSMLADGDHKKSLSEKLGLPIFIQRFLEDRRIRKRHESPRIIGDDVSSPEFEAFRKLMFNLGIDEPTKEKQVIYITSPGPEAGKTFITLNLAVALAASGNWVVIADTDFRKRGGHLTDVANVRTRFGLFDVLREKASLKDVIVPLEDGSVSKDRKGPQTKRSAKMSEASVRSPRAFIDVLPTGRIPANPFLFLESTEMSKIVELLKETYDFVLIDGVPVLLFADAAFLCKFADSVVLTARYGRTGLKELEYSRDILFASKSDNVGLVMNGVPRERGSYYYSYYFKYYSKYNKRGSK